MWIETDFEPASPINHFAWVKDLFPVTPTVPKIRPVEMDYSNCHNWADVLIMAANVGVNKKRRDSETHKYDPNYKEHRFDHSSAGCLSAILPSLESGIRDFLNDVEAVELVRPAYQTTQSVIALYSLNGNGRTIEKCNYSAKYLNYSSEVNSPSGHGRAIIKLTEIMPDDHSLVQNCMESIRSSESTLLTRSPGSVTNLKTKADEYLKRLQDIWHTRLSIGFYLVEGGEAGQLAYVNLYMYDNGLLKVEFSLLDGFRKPKCVFIQDVPQTGPLSIDSLEKLCQSLYKRISYCSSTRTMNTSDQRINKK